MVSKQDAEFWRTRKMAGIRTAEEFYRLCATVEALYERLERVEPIVEGAARQNCRNLQEKWPDTCGHCVTCQARELDKEGKDVPGNSPAKSE